MEDYRLGCWLGEGPSFYVHSEGQNLRSSEWFFGTKLPDREIVYCAYEYFEDSKTEERELIWFLLERKRDRTDYRLHIGPQNGSALEQAIIELMTLNEDESHIHFSVKDLSYFGKAEIRIKKIPQQEHKGEYTSEVNLIADETITKLDNIDHYDLLYTTYSPWTGRQSKPTF